MIQPRLGVTLVILSVVLAGSCKRGGDSPTQPTIVLTLDGTYTGNAVGGQPFLTRFLLTATVSGGVVTGTLGAPDGSGHVPLSGTASAGGDVTMTATDQCGGARYTLTGSIAHDSSGTAHITGTWSQVAQAGCPGSSGNFTMTRARTDGGSPLFPAGTWAGTLSRPGGETIALTWVATRYPPPNSTSDAAFDGPLTMTYRGVTVTARLFGPLSGSNTAGNGYQFNFNISMQAGASSAAPNCSISSTTPGPTPDLRDSSRTISSQPFTMHYGNCYGFTTNDPNPPQGFTGESAQLILNKQ